MTFGAFVASASQSSSSPSSSKVVSDLEGDLAIIGPLSKRKANLSPAGSQRAQKFARTDTSHRPGRSMKATEATSRTQGAFERRASTTSPISVKNRKELLAPNREFLRPLPKPGSGTFIISSQICCRDLFVSKAVPGEMVPYPSHAELVLALKVSFFRLLPLQHKH